MQDKTKVIDSKINADKNEPRSSRLRTGLLVAGSALLGGIAVVLWNRRSLTNMQTKAQEKAPQSAPFDDDAIY